MYSRSDIVSISKQHSLTSKPLNRLKVLHALFLYEQFYKNEAPIYPKIKNKLRTIETRLQMQMQLQVFIEKHNTMLQGNHENFLRKTVAGRRQNPIWITNMFAVITDMHDGKKNNLRTIEAQIVQRLKNNEARPKSTGSCIKKRVLGFFKPYLAFLGPVDQSPISANV